MASQTLIDSVQPSTTPESRSQVRVQLSTRHPDITFSENPGPILVNTNFRRYALSTVVNTLLKTDPPIPFEFLINGQFLRTSIDEYLTANGISAETTLPVEYVRAIIPPLYVASFEHDDWVSSVDVLSRTSMLRQKPNSAGTQAPGQERILSGSYDGLLRVWNTSSEVLTTSPSAGSGGHTAAVKVARFLTSSQLVSAGLDRAIKIWKYADDIENHDSSIAPYMDLYGHTASIDAIDVDRSSLHVLSASSDHSVGLWSGKKAEAPAAPSTLIPSAVDRSAKRRKVGPATSTPQRGPLAMLKSHAAPVSSVIFAPNDHTVAYSASWDHTMKTWDLPTSTNVETRTTSHSLLSLASLPNLNLIAAGTSARHITLIDPRASASTVAAMTLRGHTNAVVALATDPDSAYGLASGSHDGTCRIWDVRSSHSEKDGRIGESMYCIERESAKGEKRKTGGEGVKVFGLCWDRELGILSASEDKRIQINRGKAAATQAIS